MQFTNLIPSVRLILYFTFRLVVCDFAISHYDKMKFVHKVFKTKLILLRSPGGAQNVFPRDEVSVPHLLLPQGPCRPAEKGPCSIWVSLHTGKERDEHPTLTPQCSKQSSVGKLTDHLRENAPLSRVFNQPCPDCPPMFSQNSVGEYLIMIGGEWYP